MTLVNVIVTFIIELHVHLYIKMQVKQETPLYSINCDPV